MTSSRKSTVSSRDSAASAAAREPAHASRQNPNASSTSASSTWNSASSPLVLGQRGLQSSPFSTNWNQLRSTSDACRTRPRRERLEVGTAFCFSCSPVNPWHFMARVARW